MAKIPIYCIPGLGSGPEIFKNLNLSEELYEVFTLKWIEPISNQEKITDYAKRMCKQVLKVNPVLLGVSFGGIMAQEMGNHLNCKKIILISSIKHQTEKPKIFKFLKVTKLYQLAPCSLITNLEQYRIFFIGVKLKKKFNNIKTYLNYRNKKQLQWAIKNTLLWQVKKESKNIVHIHGNKDGVFPIKHISNCIEINNGNHSMILTKAKEISAIINLILINN